MSYHHSHCCRLPFRIAKTKLFSFPSLVVLPYQFIFSSSLFSITPSFLISVQKCSQGLSHLSAHSQAGKRQHRLFGPLGRVTSTGQFCERPRTPQLLVVAQSAKARVLDGQKSGSALSCQASGAANCADCPLVVVMPNKLSCKAHAAQVFPRASHTVTR